MTMRILRTAALLLAAATSLSCEPSPRAAGEIAGGARSAETIGARRDAQVAARAALAVPDDKQILFGDLHVHSAFSVDAFMYALPLFGSAGAHPPADACDFARHCAGLDFFSINDHAEGLSPHLWRETVESIRECNRRAGDANNPDMVAFLGWEWTQTSNTPEEHYGHQNVIFPGLDDDEIPARPISSIAISTYEQTRPPAFVMNGAAAAVRALGYGAYADVLSAMTAIAETPDCADGIPSPRLPLDCRESATTPAALFRKLDEWNLETLVIPHGLAWGIHAPPGARLDTQLTAAFHDPSKQRLIEIMSGHGNSEEYRDFAEYRTDDSDRRVCPEPTSDYEPCCWRAGEIMRARCGDLPRDECERRVAEARQLALEGGVSPDLVFLDTNATDWLDCDQCRDCFKPAMTLRPMMTAQYGAAISNFDEPESDGRPRRFRWGFIASTDNHTSRPGTGYKQHARTVMTDSRGMTDAVTEDRARRWLGGGQRDPRRAQEAKPSRFFELFDTERKASFMYPGGIVAVHSSGRDRRAIWDALQRKEVYGTSGPRMLLWFDLVNAPGGTAPMGAEVAMADTPHFVARAAGAFEQLPGCPREVRESLTAERIHDLCRDECHHPGARRHRIVAIEVIRIRPQREAGESIAPLIEDPWLRLPCDGGAEGCRVAFSDPDFAATGRDTVYYVRALQEETPAINAATLRATVDESGRATSINECHGGYRTPNDDDCLAPISERAWSSPIYIDFLTTVTGPANGHMKTVKIEEGGSAGFARGSEPTGARSAHGGNFRNRDTEVTEIPVTRANRETCSRRVENCRARHRNHGDLASDSSTAEQRQPPCAQCLRGE